MWWWGQASWNYLKVGWTPTTKVQNVQIRGQISKKSIPAPFFWAKMLFKGKGQHKKRIFGRVHYTHPFKLPILGHFPISVKHGTRSHLAHRPHGTLSHLVLSHTWHSVTFGTPSHLALGHTWHSVHLPLGPTRHSVTWHSFT